MSIDLLIYAGVAVFLFVMLFRVLGTRHGSEPIKHNPFVNPPSFDKDPNPVTVAAQDVTPTDTVAANANADVQQALFQMALLDKNFDATQFVSNAKEAYRIVVEAFAADDKNTLQDLLTPAVYKTFKQALDDRTQSGEKLDIEVRGINKAEIIAANVNEKGEAFIKLRFSSEQIRVTRDKDGVTIDGSETYPDRLVDDWVFTRLLKSSDPRWLVCETEDGDPSDGPL